MNLVCLYKDFVFKKDGIFQKYYATHKSIEPIVPFGKKYSRCFNLFLCIAYTDAIVNILKQVTLKEALASKT